MWVNTCLHTQQPGAELTPLKCTRKPRLSHRRRLFDKKQTTQRRERTINKHGIMLKHGMMHDNFNYASKYTKRLKAQI